MMKKKCYRLLLLITGLLLPLQAQARCDSNRNPYGIFKPIHNDLYFCTPDVTLSSATIPSHIQNLLLASGSRDNLPQRMAFEFPFGNDNFFPFSSRSGYSVGLSLTMHLDKLGTVDNYGIYRINDYIGVRVDLAEPSHFNRDRARIDLPQGIRTDLRFRNGDIWENHTNSLGLKMVITPMLLKSFPAGTTLTPPAPVKIATVDFRKKQYQPGSPGNGIAATGKTHSDIWLDLSGFTIRSELKTCSLDPAHRNITLTFPTVAANSFKNIGDLVYGATTQLQLDCSQAGRVTPYAILQDVQDPTNRSDQLTIESGAGKATGVKIKLFKDNDQNALRYGAINDNGWNTPENSWQFSAQGERYPKVKLTGYYVKSENTITPGEVKAQTIIIFSYQ